MYIPNSVPLKTVLLAKSAPAMSELIWFTALVWDAALNCTLWSGGLKTKKMNRSIKCEIGWRNYGGSKLFVHQVIALE